VKLTNLNVLIGPNGVGKSNFIEAIELLHATPADFSGVIRLGGTPTDWIWHGRQGATVARIEALLSPVDSTPQLRYAIEFAESAGRLEITDEVLEEANKADPRANDVRFYYRFQRGHPAINISETHDNKTGKPRPKERKLRRESIDPQQSILSQRKDPDLYPEVTATASDSAAFRCSASGASGVLLPCARRNLPTCPPMCCCHSLSIWDWC
jgi:predicted ATPase